MQMPVYRRLLRGCVRWSAALHRSSNQSQRHASAAAAASQPHFTVLHSRKLVRLTGNDSAGLLQALVTNDINYLISGEVPCVYCMQLDVRGRVLFDLLVTRLADNQFTVEVECSRVRDYVSLLSRYRMRKQVDIEVLDSHIVGCLVDPAGQQLPPAISTSDDPKHRPLSAHPDARLDLLGVRLALPAEAGDSYGERLADESQQAVTSTDNEDLYTALRYKLGIAEGGAEIVPGKSLPLEYNLDYLNGVSFHKGCYIGQELTARTHHTGVVRKRLMPVQLLKGDWRQVSHGTNVYAWETSTDEINGDQVEVVKGRPLGKFCAATSDNTLGLAVLNVDKTVNGAVIGMEQSGAVLKAVAHCPSWWPDTGHVKGFQPE